MDMDIRHGHGDPSTMGARMLIKCLVWHRKFSISLQYLVWHRHSGFVVSPVPLVMDQSVSTQLCNHDTGDKNKKKHLLHVKKAAGRMEGNQGRTTSAPSGRCE
jgi:hypothetical protein